MKPIILLIIKYLRKELSSGHLTPDAAEGVEVAVQCLESAYGVTTTDTDNTPINLEDLYLSASAQSKDTKSEPDENQEEAEALKLLGNKLMKESRYDEAICLYSRAIVLDPENPVYFCNRAAAHIQLENYADAVNDCDEAIRLDCTYSKAYSRMGYAYQATGSKIKAKECYRMAMELDPTNESYRNSYVKLENPGGSTSQPQPAADLMGLLPGIDLAAIMKNPSFVRMASQMLEDPSMQHAVSRILSGQSSFPAGQVEDLISAGQQLAETIQGSSESQSEQGASTSPETVSATVSESEGAAAPLPQTRRNVPANDPMESLRTAIGAGEEPSSFPPASDREGPSDKSVGEGGDNPDK